MTAKRKRDHTSHDAESAPTIAATEITGCLRGIVYKRQGKEAPPLHPELLEQFERFRGFGETGQSIQQQLTRFWQAKGSLISPGDFIPPDRYGFTGRYDAICRIRGKLVLYEIKGVSQTFFRQLQEHVQAREYHRTQLMIYHKALLDRFSDLEPRLLYVPRGHFLQKKLTSIEVPIDYTEEDFQFVLANAKAVRVAIQGGPLPPAVPAVVGEGSGRMINMEAMMCRQHGLCLDDAAWYEHAKAELGLPETAAEEEQPEEVPF